MLFSCLEHSAILGAVLTIGAVVAIVLIGRRWFAVCLVAELLVSCGRAVAACALVRASGEGAVRSIGRYGTRSGRTV